MIVMIPVDNHRKEFRGIASAWFAPVAGYDGAYLHAAEIRVRPCGLKIAPVRIHVLIAFPSRMVVRTLNGLECCGLPFDASWGHTRLHTSLRESEIYDEAHYEAVQRGRLRKVFYFRRDWQVR
jgi:hypothetical protein